MTVLNERLKAAVGHQRAWDEITATETGRVAMHSYLVDSLAKVDRDLADRKAEFKRLPKWQKREAGAEYDEWRRRALGFKAMAVRRIGELKQMQRSAHFLAVTRERDCFKEALIRLAAAVEVGGDSASVLLDEIEVPDGVGTLTLRELVGVVLERVGGAA